MEKKRGGDGSSPASSTGATHTTIYTMHTELRWGQSGRGSPRALPALLLPAPGPLGRAATRQPRLALRPSLRPASCRPFLPSLRARALVLPPTRGSLALRRGCSPAPLPAGGSVALPGAGSVQFAGRGGAVEPPGKSPPGRCCAASSLSACPGEPPRGRRRLPCCLSPLHLSWHSAPGCRSARGPAPAPCRRRTRTTRTRS